MWQAAWSVVSLSNVYMVLAGFVCGKQLSRLCVRQAAWSVVSLSMVLAGFVCGKQHGTLSLSLMSMSGKQHGLSVRQAAWSVVSLGFVMSILVLAGFVGKQHGNVSMVLAGFV